jgi:hypothetical protein
MRVDTRGKILGAWLGHPVTVVALLVLVVNDHVLKAAYPGVVTGKLSDAAGLVLAPPLLALLIRRPAAALWSVAAVFSLVKSSGYASSAASEVWSLLHGPSMVRADLSDLLTLPFLGVAWWAYRSASRRPVASRWVRALRMAVLLPLALGGVVATSEVPASYATRVVSTKQAVYLISESRGHQDWVVSFDEALSWKESDTAPPPAGAPARQACSAAKRKLCYRVDGKTMGVQRTADGGATWRTDWHVGDGDRRKLARQYPNAGDYDTDLVSVAVAVHDTDDGGHVVVVANRRDGFAVRDTDGVWKRIGFPETGYDDDVPALGEVRLEEKGFWYGGRATIFALVLALVVVAGAAAASTRRWWIAVPALVTGTGTLLFLGYVGLDPDTFAFYPFVIVGPAVSMVVCLAVAASATAGVLRGGFRGSGWAWLVWAIGVLAGGAAGGGWFLRIPVWQQVAAGVVAAVAGILLAVRVAGWLRPPRPRTTHPIASEEQRSR